MCSAGGNEGDSLEFSHENYIKMDENPSHQTHSVTYQIDQKGVGNIIDMGSIAILLVWFDYNRLIRQTGDFLGLNA